MNPATTEGGSQLRSQSPGLLSSFRLQAAALGLLFLAAYWAPLQGLFHIWQTNEDYSYGPLIPLVSLYILWEKRSELALVERRANWLLFPPLCAMLLLSLYGVLGSSGNIALPSIPILLLLFAAFCFGTGLARRLLLPLGFLIFMIPVPAVLERTLGMYLKSVSSVLGTQVVRSCGIPVFLSGNVIDLGVTQLQVVDACNGLRYLFPLIATGVAYAYLMERVVWKRVCLVLATVPIAILINGLRIGVTGVLANRFGVAAAEGFFHDFTGWVLYLVAFAFLVLTGRLLALFPSRGYSEVPPPAPGSPVGWALPTKANGRWAWPTLRLPLGEERGDAAAEVPSPGGVGREKGVTGHRAQHVPFLFALLLLLVVGGFTWSTSALPPVQLKGGMAAFPTEFGGWQGSVQALAPEMVTLSGAEDAFAAQYRDSGGETVSLYLGYRSSAFLENENFFHSPTVCLPSNGLKTVGKKVRTIGADPVWGDLKVTEMLLEDAGTRMLVYFWFHTKSRQSHLKDLNRFHLTLHALARDNTYDLFLRPITRLKPGETVEAGEERLDRFVRELSRATRSFVAQQTR